ncbi:MAG: hypothetical protein AAF211_30255 [Myxococcota bacterium]
MTINLETKPLHASEQVSPGAEPTYIGIDRGLKTFAVLGTAEGRGVECSSR